MLPHYSPLKVAETFSVLCGLYGEPHRPEASVARRAADPSTSFALQRDRRVQAADDFPRAARRADRLPRRELPRGPSARPARPRRFPASPRSRPSSGCSARRPQSAIWAGRARSPLLLRRLHSTRRAPRSLPLYRERFTPVARARRSRGSRSPSRRSAPRRTPRPRAPRRELAHGDRPAAQRTARAPSSAGREGARVPLVGGRLPQIEVSGARRFVVGSPRARSQGGSRTSRPSTARRGGRGRDDHL